MVSRFALFFGVWLVLTGAKPDALIFGLLAAAGAVALGRHLAPAEEWPLRLAHLLVLAPGFLWRSMVGGADVAWRVFHPAMPLKAGWVVHPARLPAGAPRVLLSSGLSLMPGTLCAGERDDGLLVHCLDTDRAVARQLAQEEARYARLAADD